MLLYFLYFLISHFKIFWNLYCYLISWFSPRQFILGVGKNEICFSFFWGRKKGREGESLLLLVLIIGDTAIMDVVLYAWTGYRLIRFAIVVCLQSCKSDWDQDNQPFDMGPAWFKNSYNGSGKNRSNTRGHQKSGRSKDKLNCFLRNFVYVCICLFPDMLPQSSKFSFGHYFLCCCYGFFFIGLAVRCESANWEYYLNRLV